MRKQKFLKLIFGLCSFISFEFKAQDIFDAARKGDIQRAVELIKINPDTISKKNGAGFTPLILAAYRNQVRFIEFLLSRRVNLNEDSPEGTALLAACYRGSMEIAEILIKHGANKRH